jgi:replicative DNA helicase
MKKQPLELGKLPPQALDFEEIVLGTIMLEKEALLTVITILQADHFYREAHQKIYAAISDLYNNNDPVDIITVTERLKHKGHLDSVGGAYFIATLTNKVATGANVEYHAYIIKQKYIRREHIRVGSELVRAGFDESTDDAEPFEMLNRSHELLTNLMFGSRKAAGFLEVSRKSFEELEHRVNLARKGLTTGINTGFAELNRAIGGWNSSDLVIIAGRPGMGKTAIALHFAKIAAQSGKSVYLVSLEMKDTRLADRIIIGETETNSYKYKHGKIEDEAIAKVKSWVETKSNIPIYIDENSMVNIDYITSNARIYKRKKMLDLLVIDYLQLIDVKTDKSGTREQAISAVTRRLKTLAKELDVPVIVLSQLSRAVESRGGEKKPILSDLRESGAIEQDADIVLFVYRPSYYDLETYRERPTENLTILDVAKNRNGQANVDIFITNNESLTNFYDTANDLPQEITPF